MFNLSGKRALITGATGGIGKSISKALLAQGAEVILSATKEEKLKELVIELSAQTTSKINYFACDLSCSKSVDGLIDSCEELFGQIDILVCNAGITKDSLILRMKEEDFNHVIDVNLKSTFVLNRNSIKKMIKRKYGRIINITSVVASTGNPGQANYVASKAGIIGMSKSLALEVASRSITINCVSPGFIQSPMTDVLTDQQKSNILNKIPANRMGNSQEIAYAVAFLASDEASYITGETLHVNGGMFMS